MKKFRYQRLVTNLVSFFIMLCLLALNSRSVMAQGTQREISSYTTTILKQASTLLQLQQTDIIFNGGFEVGDLLPLGWQKDAWTLSYSTFLWDTTKKHSGNKSIEIANSYNNDAQWIQTVYVQANSDYLLSGWIKTQIVAHTLDSVDAGANLSLLGGFERTNGLFGTNDWTYVTLPFNTGSRTQVDIAARLGMYSGTTTGIAWFDDLKLELVSTPTCYTLTKNVVPLGSGTINVDPLPNCNNGTQYVHGTVVKLTSTPNATYKFVSWSGDASEVLNPIYLTMTANKSVTANFGYPLNVVKAGVGYGTVNSSPAGINCGSDCSETYVGNTSVTLTATAPIGSAFTSWNGACSGTGNCIVSMTAAKSVTANFSQSSTPNPQWKILVLIYSSTDFTYSDDLGTHHVVASMSQNEIDRAVSASNQFVGVDVPALTSGNMIPLLTIRYPNHPLSSLDAYCGYWPSQMNTQADLDPLFDSVIVIWDGSGTDLNTSQSVNLNGCGGLAAPNGIEQTYSTFVIDLIPSNQRNVFKHEWGHSILFYFEATGQSPIPTVDNHINDTTNIYVHCSSGTPYILQDETDDNPIPNSIYNDVSGFTHDYYSGTTAKPGSPNKCLGITPTAWSSGGPVTKPSTFSDISASYWALDFIKRLYSAGITGGCNVSPLQYCPEGIVTRAQMAIFLERGIHGSSYNPPAVGGSTGFGDVLIDYWAGAWIKQLAAEGITGGCGSGNYCPESPVTRAQMAIFLLRSKHGASYSPPAVVGSTGFGDVHSDYWAGAWIKQLVAEGITAGCGTGTYCPESPVTRAQMAVFLVRTFNLP